MTRFACAALLALAACTSPSERASVTVFAASSLTDAFRELAEEHRRRHPGVDVILSFAGSQTLRLQIEQGAPADVFASANPEHAAALVAAHLIGAPRVFAHNDLVIVVPRRARLRVDELADLATVERLVVGTAAVPIGRYTDELLTRIDDALAQRIRARIVSREHNVRLVLAKVALDEVDAGIVYRSDALSNRDVAIVEFPSESAPTAEYVIASVGDEGRGASWVALVTSATGRAVLRRHGFAP